MNVSVYSWIVILLALLAANLPFLNQHLFAVVPLGRGDDFVKPVWWRLIEMLVLYFVVGGIAYAMEATLGNVFPHGWEFYAITGCLFLVFSFPGYVFRYLYKHH
ncbi:DUF2818 family protein [Oxalobacteraceae bacterium CAVE-383]|nr:DUF2818 family protein [Oxalobacteraceae bacterium CAVE-383]